MITSNKAIGTEINQIQINIYHKEVGIIFMKKSVPFSYFSKLKEIDYEFLGLKPYFYYFLEHRKAPSKEDQFFWVSTFRECPLTSFAIQG